MQNVDCPLVTQEGEAATVSLLAMAQRTIEQMDAVTASQHSDACFTFLLRALDLRQKRPAHLSGLDAIEQGSVAVLLALTMKLSEAKFKPLFLRLLDWAATPPAAQPGQSCHTIIRTCYTSNIAPSALYYVIWE